MNKPILDRARGFGRHTRNPAAVYLAGLSVDSQIEHHQCLNAIARIALDDEEATFWYVPWQDVRGSKATAILDQLHERFAESTVKRQLSALRGVLERYWELGHLTAEEYEAAVDDLFRWRPKSMATTGKPITVGNVTLLPLDPALDEDDNSPSGQTVTFVTGSAIPPKGRLRKFGGRVISGDPEPDDLDEDSLADGDVS